MSTLAQQHNAINLSQGFPDFHIDPQLSQALGDASRNGFNQYAPMPGLPALRQAIAANFNKRYGVAIDADTEITITPGATYAIYTAFTAILTPGDEVIVLEPAYDSYIPNIEMNGARVVPVALSAPDFHVDWNKVKDAITRRTGTNWQHLLEIPISLYYLMKCMNNWCSMEQNTTVYWSMKSCASVALRYTPLARCTTAPAGRWAIA